MGNVKRTKSEYGGFLPLELNPGREYYADHGDRLHRFNSVKAALDFLIRCFGKHRIYIPYYYCPSTTEAIRRTGIEVCFYHIDAGLMPADVPDEADTTILLVDYFGTCSERIDGLSRAFRNAEVIVDKAHDFFSPPVISWNIHTVYSARKFFGVPDGAYLISSVLPRGAESPSAAHGYAGYLFTSYEEGTDAAYQMKKAADRQLAEHYGCMSGLSIGLLQNVDYGRVRKKREDNYRILYEAFQDVNGLRLPMPCASYQFPLLLPGQGEGIKQRLVSEKIYVPTLWAGRDLLENGNAFERTMMRDAVFLPMDQRYDEEDMAYLVSRVKIDWRRPNDEDS